jgi:hypothetical protein
MKIRFLKYVGVLALLVLTTSGYSQFIYNNGLQLSNSALLVTNGDWLNDAGSNITHNGILRTSESFTNNGTLSGSSTGGFELLYNSNLNFKPGGPNFGYLVKKGTGDALVTGSVIIKDSVALHQGLVRLLTSADTLTVITGALITAGPTSYVEGNFAHSGTGDFYFPLGKDGKFMPLTIFKGQASRATASIINIPAGSSAGPGVDSLINFPYAWKVDKKAATDTAAYVQVSYPNTLPVASNPIIVRNKGANVFVSMGARFKENNAGYATVRSYSRRLRGMYTVASGLPVDSVTDSLALVAFFDATGGSLWTTKTGWKLTADVDSWFGVEQSGQSVTSLLLPGNNLIGTVPEQLVDIVGLEIIDLSNNQITSIPDFTPNTEITSLNVSKNKLTFASLEPNATVPGISYLEQTVFGVIDRDTVAANTDHTLSANAGGASSVYQWKRNGVNVAGANSPSYTIEAIGRATMGDYVAEVTNPLLPGLTLTSQVQTVLASANIHGTLYASTNVRATKGNVTLYRVTTTGAFEKVETDEITSSEDFAFDKKILDDYQILGFVDTINHVGSIPTYYKNTILWEEADTLFLNENVEALDIVSQIEPSAPSGHGVISGTLSEDDGTGRQSETQKPKRVGGAGVNVRRVENTGRGKDEILTLVAYVFTNEEGEFDITNLPEGNYRLNIQYPGYPMDPTSFITIPIGGGLQSLVQVEANVEEGLINVRKLLITNVYTKENYDVQVFPNPAVDFIQLKFGKESLSRRAVMMDMSGKKLDTYDATQKESRINVAPFQKGLYLMQIVDEGTIVKTIKVSIE